MGCRARGTSAIGIARILLSTLMAAAILAVGALVYAVSRRGSGYHVVGSPGAQNAPVAHDAEV